APAELPPDGEKREEREAHTALDHLLRGLDRLDLERHVGDEPRPAEETVGECPVARAPVEEDERSVGHLLEARPPLPSRPGGRARDQDERVVPKGERLDLGVVDGARQPDLRLGAQHHLEDLLRVPRPDGDEDLGVRGLEALEHVGQEVGADREHGGDAERAARRRAEVVDRLAGEGDGVEELLGVGTERAPRRGERHAVLAPLEEPHAQRVFEGADARAHGRLSEAERFGGAAGAAVAADGLPRVRRRRLPELLDRDGDRHLLPLVRHLRRAEPRGVRRGIVEHMGRTFRQLLITEPYLFTGGVYDPLGAQLAERAGMRSVYLSGYSMAMAQGWPDMGFLTQTEVTRIASMVASAVSIPIIADADDGYGNALSTIRTVQEYVKTGVAGIHIEDQRFPKRCGHIAGKTVVSLEEALGKYRAAVDTRDRLDPDFVIIARTDAQGAVG